MKTTMKKIAKTIALMLGLAAVQTAAAGDIAWIKPCTADGTIVTNTSDDIVVDSGSNLYFKVVLVEKNLATLVSEHHPWRLQLAQEGVDEGNLPKFGIYVSGKKTYAEYVRGSQVRDESTGLTSLIFKYTTRAGDLALPIVASRADSTPADQDSSNNLFDVDLGDWILTNNYDTATCDFTFIDTTGGDAATGGVRVRDLNSIDGYDQVQDYDLRGCNFYVQTVDFDRTLMEGDDGVKTSPEWRIVHEGSTTTITEALNKLKTVGGGYLTEQGVFYVWSDNEESSYVKAVGGTDVTTTSVTTNYEGGTALVGDLHIAEVRIYGDSNLSQNFDIYGVKSNTTANLVLSPWKGYRFNAANQRIDTDYITIPVTVTNALPTSIQLSVTENVTATSDYLRSAGTITLKWSDAQYDNDVNVTLTPTFYDADDALAADWTDYFRIATTATKVDEYYYAGELPTAQQSRDALTVTLKAHDSSATTLYILALTGDARTGTAAHHFTITATAPAAEFPEQTESGRMPTDKQLYIEAEAPSVTYGGFVPASPRQSDSADLIVVVTNVYADAADTATGYTLNFYPDAGGSPETLDGTYAMHPTLKRLVKLDNGAYTTTLPSYTYTTSGTLTSRIEVVSPISGLTAYTDFEVTVRPVRTATIAADAATYNEGDQMTVTVEISEKHSSDKLYAFLRATKYDGNDLTDTGAFSETKCVITSDSSVDTSSGWEVDAGTTTIYIPVQDGSAETKNMRFTLRLCTSQVYSTANDVTSRYKLGDTTRPSPLVVTLANVAPVIPSDVTKAGFTVNGYALKSYIDESGVPYLPKKLIPGEKLRITPDITDVAYDMSKKLKWTITASHHADDTDNTTEPPDPVIITNTTSTIAAYNDYELPGGKWNVTIFATDKDGEDSGSYTFWVEIVDESKIRLAVSTEVSGETSDVFDETSTRATVSVTLPYYDNQNLLVKLTVTPPSSGFIELDSAYKQTAHDGYPDLGDNEYYILFRGQGTETISVTAMDGTTVSAAQGFSLQAEVVTTNVYAKANKAWNAYYAKSRVTKVFVNNATPQFGNCTAQNTESNAWRVAGGSASAIKWAVDLKKECMYDITNKWETTVGGDNVTTNGIKVTIDGCSNGGVFFADSATPGGNFQPVFSSDALGVQAVTINIEDKDGDGPEQLTYYYEIVAAKYLTTVATGPSTGNADISLSTKYGAAKGIGEGHVWVSGATHNGTENFFAQWNCNLAVKVLVYAFGYMADDIDNGNLNKTADGTERDIWIDAYGNHKVNATKPTSDDEFYRNSDNTYDSFFYGWIKASEPGGTDYSVSYAPQVGTNKDVTAQIALPTAMTDDEIGYPETYIEAIFSREYSYYDNLGDINRDGIPDIFARYEYMNGALSSFDGQAGELPAVNSKNDDGDYYPGSSHIGESATPPGAVSGWETSGQGFTAFREIRGYHDGLNYGMFRYDATERKNGWISDLEMSDLEKKALLREVFKRRDYLTNKLLTTQLTNDGVNNEIREYELITNLLAQVYYKGASQGSGQVFFRMSDEEIAANTSPVEVVTTNVVGDVTTVETNLVNAWIRTFRPAYATEDTVVTNFFAEAVSNELDNVLRIPNPSDSLSYEHVDIGNWLDREYNNNARAQQETAKAWITYTWRHIERAGQWGFTVENRTDPTTDDTDGDDMPDGYEYYMWYCAMVGTGTNELTGCRFNLADVESYDDIIDAETIRDLYNPNKFHDWTRTDTDNDGIMDYEEFLIGTSPIHWDSDRDGLSDLYEVIYNINPVSAAGGSNGAVNGDGDFMAYCQNPDGTNYWVYAVLGSDGTTTNLWAIYTDDAVEIDTNEVQQTVTGRGCQVAMFNGGYIPVTENTKVLTRTISKNILTSVTPTNAPLSLYHHQVHNYFGFDPRTGWYSSPAGLSSGRFGLIAGKAVNTSAFKAIDEFRLIKYRYIVGLRNAAQDQSNINANKTTMHSVILAGTTNPSANFDSRTWGDSETTYAQSQHGADTDGDAVPDGWELYVGVDPNRDFRIAKGSSGYDSLYWDGNGIWPAAGDAEIYTDGMTLAREYAGTDSCGAYSGCSTIYANHPSQANSTIVKWFNKFMPTDPHNDDTDGDGLDDGEEGKNWTGSYTMNRWGQDGNRSKGSTPISGVVYHMFYGNPSDDDSTCIAGGGYNPCSIDTDGDALPDPWEHQYTGLVFKNDQIMTEANSGEGNYVFPPTTGVPGSVYDDIRAAVSALGWWEKNITNDVWHIIMGMDGTVADAYSYTSQKSSDLDWDGDGLQNWQEYMVQAMRHLRYDDDKTPLMGRDIPAFNTISGEFEQGSWNGDKGFLKISYSSPIDSTQYHTLEELGYKNFVAYLKENSDYLRELGYFAEPPMEWDYAKLSLGYVYMLPPKCARPLEARATTSYTQLLDDSDHGVWGYAAEGDDEYVMASRYSGTTITNTTDSLEVYDPTLDYADGTILNYYNIYYVVVENDPDDASVQHLDRVVRLATASHTTYHVTSNLTYKARGYVGTDPRLWDTDEDGMDDYYEIFHGLNPILGNVGTISSSTVTNSDGSVTSSYFVDDTRDVIADMYGNVTGMRNGWVGWNNLERPAYDAIRYPWMMGEGQCDADGDGLRNFEESIAVNLTDPQNYHTDPTPLWMTDSSGDYTNYAATVTAVITNIDTSVSYRDPATGQRVYKTTVITNELTYGFVALMKSPSYVGLYYSNFLRDDYLTSYKTTSAFSHYAKHFFSFEENEGYDTDNDWRSDDVEMRKTVEVTSDPLNAVDLPRRQSIWFGGASEPGAAISYELSKRSTLGYDLFKQFTLEAWVRPEEPASGQDQYIVSRASNYAGWDLANSESVIRMNFALGVDSNGNLFGEMQNSTDTSFRLTGGAAEAGVWTHLAATYDGTTFRVYVNGAEAASIPTKLIPANGVISTLQDPQYARAFPYEIYSYAAVPSATILGARANGAAAFDVNFAGNATAWSDVATDFFKGSVSEVRIWDGARSAEDILADRDARYTVESIKALRDTVYAQYHQGARRTNGNLNPELVQHFGFDSLPGATETQYVVIEPAGFASDVVGQVQNPDTGAALTDAVKIGWWSKIAENPNIGTVYSSPYVVPWIENTVAHLPKLSGVLADSVFWGEQFAGYTPSEFHDGLGEFKIANSMNPYNIVTLNGDEIENQHRKFYRVSISTYGNGDALPENQATNNNEVYQMNLYDRRMAFNGTTDLIPLGSAFAKRLSESWDGEGPEDAWSSTVGDFNSDGIPQWAIEAGYTADNYRAALADGLLPDGALHPEFAAYANGADTDGNNIPDWWERYFGIVGCDPNGDPDNDGLSNFQEYLISFGDYTVTEKQQISLMNRTPANKGMHFLDPTNAHSPDADGNAAAVVDYFLKPDSSVVTDSRITANSYYGEMVGDHDFMETWWETYYNPNEANAYVYDSHLDVDGDGWSNWGENRARFNENTWVVTGANTNSIVVTFDVGDPTWGVWLATNRNTIASVDWYTDYNGWFQAEVYDEDYYDNLRSVWDSYRAPILKYRYTIIEETPIKSYGGLPLPNINLKLYGVDSVGTNGITLAAYSGSTLAMPDATFAVTATPVNGVIETTIQGRGLKEGINTFIATTDDGKVGIARNVNVGFDSAKVEMTLADSELYFSLAATTNTIGLSTIDIRRTAVNGTELDSPRRVYVKNIKLDTARTFTPAELINSANPDFDWRRLASDLAELEGVNAQTVEYTIYVDGEEQGTITRTFNFSRSIATAVAPLDNALVYSASPTFRFASSDATMSAYRLQVANSEGEVIWDSGAVELPSAEPYSQEYPNLWAVTPNLYADCFVSTNGTPVFADGEGYKWRVALLNAKYPTADSDSDWCAWTPFQMDVANKNQNPDTQTGYGNVAAAVRYYGAGGVTDLSGASNIVVEAYATPDFTAMPLSRALLDDISNIANVNDTTTTNCIMRGIAPGKAYLFAYIDSNCNGKRDKWESWGYANSVDDGTQNLYTPKAVTITDEKLAYPSLTIYIEDTDRNQNEIPDILEGPSATAEEEVSSVVDSDRDGISDIDETDYYGTDPYNADSDGDGISDGTERDIGTDPLTPDADFSVENDVMAYATIDARIVTVDDFCGPVELVVTDSSLALTRGDALTAGSTAGVTLRTAWHYGNESNYVWAVGRKFEIEEGKSWRIVDIIDNVKVALVHSQVYDEFGFNPQTANPTVSSNDWASVNSKAFTALDKSLVARWLVEIGLVDEAADWKGYMLNATTPDANKDGIPDGWELYLMFGPEGTGSADSVEAAKISPWMPPVRAMEEAPDGGGLTIAEEYDNGNEPTDPWNANTIEGPISDAFVKAYHLKGDEAAKDNDGDGLSNYAEYLITEIFKFAQLDPDKSSSNGETLDYYQKFGNLYLGELFTDHDRIGDTWEAAYEFGDIDGRDYAARGIYDSDLDLDRDGWSNYAEFRAGTNPTTDEMPAFDDYKTLEYPVPVIDLEIVYNGSLEGQDITVKAWNQEKSSNGGSVLGAPDAVWQVSKSEEATSASGSSSGTLKKFVGLMPGEKRTFYIGPGAVKAGTFKLCVMDRQFAICTLVTNPLTGELIPNVTGLGKPDDAKWYNIAIDQNGQIKTIGGIFGEDTTFGTIDYKRGVVTIDFTDEHFSMLLYGSSDDVWNESSTGSSSSSSSSSSTYDLLDLENSYVLLAWESAGVGSAVAGRYYLADTTSGHLREGLTTFTVEVTSSDTDTDSQSTDTSRAGLYAVARNVDVGWAGAKFKVELTDFSPITPRIDLWSDASDRTESVYNADPRIANSGDGTNTVTTTTATGERTRVRVVRFAVNGYPSYSSWDNSAKVILDRYYQLNGRTKFSELDFLTDDEFDIDWNTFQGEIANRRQITERSGNVTNMSYLVVFGEGTASWVDASDASAITAHKAIINRRYDYTRAKAVAIDVDNGIQYGARPTFRWKIDGEDPWTAKFGSSYTAFKIQLAYKSFNSTGMIWESGFQRMPACNANGEYEWTAPICVGDMATTNGIYKAAGGSYIWRVSVYNSKFTNNDWSDRLSFTTAAGAQQDLNDHGYSKIKVAVKYAGHPRVLERAANLTTLTGKVRVQAFSTPDFAGDPLASAVVTNATAIADLGDALPNAELRGLAANGTYYIRAYIDMDGDCELDDWESWGYAKGDVTLSSDLTAAPVATVWIEDSDTDGDWYPDAYEFVRNGWTAWEGVNHNFLSDSNPSHTELGQIAVDADGVVFLPFSATNTLTGATFSSTLPGASLSVFQSKAFINALFIGSTFDRNGIAILDFNEAAKGAITPNTFKITNMVLDRDAKVVRLTVNAEVASAIAGTVVSKYYSFAGSDSVEVTIKVYKKDTLLEKDWKLVGTFPATIKNDTDEEVEVSLGDDIDLTSGFFMIEAEEAQAGN